MRARTLFLLILAGLGCSAEDRFEGAECFQIEDCSDDAVCFLAQCVDAGFTLGRIAVVAAPPTATGLLEQQLPVPLRLEDGFQSVTLAPTITLNGAASRDGVRVAGTLEARVPAEPGCEGVLPERPLRYRSSDTSDGYSLRVPRGRYQLRFLPDDEAGLPPLSLDASAPCGSELTSDRSVDVTYPASLSAVTGRLRASSEVATPVADAAIFAETLDPDGNVVLSSRTQSDQNGEFTLFFALPEIDAITLVVGPGENPSVPVARLEGLHPGADGSLATQILSLEGEVRLTSNLLGVDESGEGTEPVFNARVLYRGTVGPGTFSVAVDAVQDAQVSASVPPGSYEILAIPPQNQPYALSRVPVQVPVGESSLTVDVVLRRRVEVSGTVRAANGGLVRGARVSFFSRESPVSREFVATTDSQGQYSLQVDPSITPGSEAEYEVIIDPSLESAEPLLRELVRVSSAGEVLDFRLNRTSFIYGRVTRGSGALVPETLLSFYSRELTDDASPIFVGSARVGEDGEFAFPVPSAPQDP